jgi:hypothetical protein
MIISFGLRILKNYPKNSLFLFFSFNIPNKWFNIRNNFISRFKYKNNYFKYFKSRQGSSFAAAGKPAAG